MPRESFDRELQQLEDELLILGSMVEQAIVQSVAVLSRRDHEGARQLMAGDRLLNKRRFALEADCLALIARRQPMATDLRTVAAVLAIASELERIGDYTKGIAKIELMMGPEPFIKPLIDIPRMAEKGRDMLHRALEAFVQRDVALARAIPEEDDEVDELYNQMYRELLALILANPANISQATYLLWVAHNLERTADQVTNICERVIFTVVGEMVEMDVGGDGALDVART
jgi:phosphate transport system protein